MGPSATRRQFLLQAGGAAVSAALASKSGWLPGCGGGDAPRWDELSARLGSRLIRPGDASYPRISSPLNRRYADVHPQGVALCSDAGDVRESLLWAAGNNVPIAVRSGGHNYAGYSTGPGLVVDLGRMRDVAVDDGDGTVTVQPGARNTMIYRGLEPHGVAISAGRCPTVAVGGLVLGGGIGFSSRKLGLTCDHLVEAELISASGERLRCSENEHADLFWALRGAGGGNFGVCTSFTFTTNPVDTVTIYDVEWEWADAARVCAAFQGVIAQAPDEFSARFGVGRAGKPGAGVGAPTVSALGQYFGPRAELVDLLEPALSAGRIKKRLIERRTFWQAKDYFFHTTPDQAWAAKSVYLDRPLSDQGVAVLLRAMDHWPGSSNADGAGAAIFASGGVINRVPADATAFVHRDKFAVLATEASWTPEDSKGTIDRNVDWIESLADSLQPHVTRSAYQNFIDRAQPDWQSAYYGDNLERLSRVKKRYDPDNRFSFEQSIPRAD